MKKGVYINSISLSDAYGRWTSALDSVGILKPLPDEEIMVEESLGRVTAEPVTACKSSPFFHSSAMDGYAVCFPDTFGASEGEPVTLKTGSQAVYVNTGDPMPDSFNAVVMIEDINIVYRDGAEHIEIIAPSTPYDNVRLIGEDIIAGELILPENYRIRALDIGAILAGGYTKIKVRKRPEVVVIPTGSEMIDPGEPLSQGKIIESNSRLLLNMVMETGGTGYKTEITHDDPIALKKAVKNALPVADIVLIIAGSSAGTKDFTAQTVGELGEIVFHGVNIKPGRPVLLGIIDNTPVFGMPGYPVSTYVTYNLFVKPLITAMLGFKSTKVEKIKARLSRPLSSSLGQEEFVRVKVGRVGDNYIATPMTRGAGILMSLVRGDGLLRIPSMSEGTGAGREAEIELIRSIDEIDNTIVCIGSHDNTLDILFNSLKKRYPEYSLSSAHVGSMGGLMAVKKGEAHIAGTHLLDEETGIYNIPFIERFFPQGNAVLVNLVYRDQGLIVKKGNPMGIRGFEDIARDDIVFINRQEGSGTRLLTDKCLRERGIEGKGIDGYDIIEFTHMGIASAVATGRADAGPGILSAAAALDLDFIPIAKERYDIIMKKETMALSMIKSFLDVIRNDNEFKESVRKLGGYDISDMGKVIFGL